MKISEKIFVFIIVLSEILVHSLGTIIFLILIIKNQDKKDRPSAEAHPLILIYLLAAIGLIFTVIKYIKKFNLI